MFSSESIQYLKHISYSSWSHNQVAFTIVFQKKKEKESSIYNKLFGLTSHLGDSGTKNNPTACNREGIVPEIKSDLFFYQWIMFMQ